MSESSKDSKADKHRPDYKGFLSFVLFFLSLLILVFTIYSIIRLDLYSLEKMWSSLTNPMVLTNHGGERQKAYITSYLSYMTQAKAQRDALFLLKEERDKLRTLENELAKLNKDKDSFLKVMEEKKGVYENNVSSFGLEKNMNELKSIGYLTRYNLQFDNDLNRRKSLYFKSYENKKAELLSDRESYKRKVAEIRQFIGEIGKRNENTLSFPMNALFINETKGLYVERVLFFIEQEEYKKAKEVLISLLSFEFDEEEMIQKALLVRMLSKLDDIIRRLDLLTKESPFDDIKMVYLSEDYKKALYQVENVNANPFLRPILSGLREALYQNIESSQEITEDLGLNGGINELMNMASELEGIGEYEKALRVYKNLLIFNLPPYDREHLVKKIDSGMVPYIKGGLKREDNTNAIKYLENARKLLWEGKPEEALKCYKLLITECPNSDYVEEALEEIINIYKKI